MFEIKRITIMVLFMLLIMGSYAQSPNSVSPATTSAGKRAEPKSDPTLPLTLDQIRAEIGKRTTTAEKFEFLRGERKSTLEAIADATAKVAVLNGKLSALQEEAPLFEARPDYFLRRKPPSKESAQSQLQTARITLSAAQRSAALMQSRPKSSSDQIAQAVDAASFAQEEFSRLGNR